MEKKLTNLPCPICSGMMTSFTTERGVFVRCDNAGCLPHESVFGFGDTEKAAHIIAGQKYKKS